MDTRTKISDVNLSSYVCNASGPLDTTLEELKKIANSKSSAIITKSCTLKPRIGNEKPRYARIPHGSIQSMGLPNLGYEKYAEFSSKLKEYNKPIIVSIAGLCLDDYITMVEAIQSSDADLIEVNLSCPNLDGKPQVAYDLEQTEEVLYNISNSGEKPIGVKLPPFYDLAHHRQMAELIDKYNINFVTCINSVGNTLVIDAEKEAPIIKPKKGYGGLCGDYIKPIALANVRAFYELFENRVSIFGVGGIKTGKDAFEFLLAGADAVQIATTFEKEGHSCFERINTELENILCEKGYTSIEDAKGKLKYIE